MLALQHEQRLWSQAVDRDGDHLASAEPLAILKPSYGWPGRLMVSCCQTMTSRVDARRLSGA